MRAPLRRRSLQGHLQPSRSRVKSPPIRVLASAASTDAPFFVAHGGFVAAAFTAWAQERPLTIRPDDLWMTLSQQLGEHIKCVCVLRCSRARVPMGVPWVW